MGLNEDMQLFQRSKGLTPLYYAFSCKGFYYSHGCLHSSTVMRRPPTLPKEVVAFKIASGLLKKLEQTHKAVQLSPHNGT